MQPHQTGGQPMNSSQLELQRIRHQMQAQMQMQAQIQQQQHQAAASHRQPQLLGSSGAIGMPQGIHGSGSLGTMSHQSLHQMPQVQLNQRFPDPAGGQQGRQRNSLGMNHAAAISLMQQQQQQGSGVSQMGGMGGASSAQIALYMSALHNASATGAGARREMGGMPGTTSMGMGPAASLQRQNSMGMGSAASLQQQSASMGLGNGQQVQQLGGQMGQSALHNASATGAGARSEMGGMPGTTSMGMGPAASLQRQNSMGMGSAASLQQQSASMGLGNGQQVQQLGGQMSQHDANTVSQQLPNNGSQMQQLRRQMSQSDANVISQQLQSMGSSSSLLTMSDTQPQMAAGTTSAQLLMHQQKMIVDLNRQLQGHITSNAGMNTSNAGPMLPPSHDRRLSSSSVSGTQLTGQQRQALFQFQQQQQRSNSMSNVYGDMQDQPHVGMVLSPCPKLGGMSLSQSPQGANDRSSPQASVRSADPMLMVSMLASQNQSSRRSSGSSQTNVTSHMFGGATVGSASEASLLMQQLSNGQNEQLLAQQPQLNNSGMQSMWQKVPLVAESSSHANSLLSGQPVESHVQQAAAEVGYRCQASDAGSQGKPDSENASDGNETEQRGRNSKSSKGSASPQIPPDETSAAGQQSYLDGTFEGGWQSNADLPVRRGVIFSIVKLIEQMRPDAENMSQKLPQMAKRLEEHLYRSARTREEYLNPSTLKRRLQGVAQGLEVHRSSSASEQPGETLQQQLQQLLQLQGLQQRGASMDFLSQEAKIAIMQPGGLSGATTGSSQSSMGPPPEGTPVSQAHSVVSSAAPAPSGILKTGKYHDPGAAQKRKVVRQQQQRLLLLRHASKCTAGAACRTKFCGQMVALWKHMKRCRNKNCKTDHCLSSRCVLNHYRMCKSENKTSTCEVCAPVMRQIKWQQSTQVEDDPMMQDNTNVSSTTATSLAAVPSAAQVSTGPDSSGQQKQQHVEVMQEKIQQQQLLLKQLKQQQADLIEQQEQLRQQQQHVQPGTQKGQQLQQQQDLLQQLQQVFQQQHLLLQDELTRQSQAIQGEQMASLAATVEPLPLDSTGKATRGGKRTSPSRKPERKSSPSRGTKSSRGCGNKGKHLSAMEIAGMGDGSHSSASTGRLKRPADPVATEMVPGDAVEIRPAKMTKVEMTGSNQMTVPQGGSAPQKAEPQGVSATEEVKFSEKPTKALEQSDAIHATSLIQSMPKVAVECHLESLNECLHLTPQAISRRCLPLIQNLIDDQFGWVFRDPVDPVVLDLPDYFDVVKNPMHLTLVETKLINNGYIDLESFARDTKLVFDNAILYNGEESEVGQMAAIMRRHFERGYNAVLMAIDSDQRALKGRDDVCTLCGSQRRLFEPTSLYCGGACGMQKIRRNATYYTDRTKQNHWCPSCYLDLDENAPVVLEDGSEVRKAALQKFKNDGLPEESWVQCDGCNGWVHQICALFNGRRNKTTAAYLCPECHIKKTPYGETVDEVKRVKVAKDLPHCRMSVEIEKGLNGILTKACENRAKELGIDVSAVEKVEDLCVRVISNIEKNHLVRDEMFKRYEKKGFPSAFLVRSKCIAMFQKIKGVDVIIFAMYVYEYSDSCPPPNRRRVYISYLDSVSYFEPKCYRTIAYHGIIMEYLRYVKERGFHSAHIWSCPPSPDDEYVFYSHPKDQLIPSETMLRQWYQCMLDKAKAEGIVLETRTLYDEYFKNNGMDATSGQAVDPTCLPYFEGDYIPGELENIIKEVKLGEEAKRKERVPEIAGLELNKKAGNKKGTRSNPGDLIERSQDKVMRRLGQAIYNMRENFLVVRLRSKAFASAVDSGDDVSGWIDVEGGEDCSSNKRFKISGKAGLSQVPFYLKSESGCTSSTDRDSAICESERGATVAADDADKGVASAAAPKVSALALGDGHDSSRPVEAAPSIKEEAALPKKKLELRHRGAIPNMSNVQSMTQAHDGVGDLSHAKIDLRDDATGLGSSEAAKLDRGADGFRPSESASKDNPATQHSDENISNEPTAALGICTEAYQPSTLASKGEEHDSTKAIQPKQSKGRGFDEIETTLSRHLALVRGNAKPVGSTVDEDEPHETEMFESRQQILNYCQANHFQFDELRRAKHSTMMILFQLHNPSAPMFLQQCGACYCDITHGTRYHCNDCSNFDLCHDCYEPVRTGLWAKRDSRFTHDKRHTFVAIDMEGPEDTQTSRDERERTIKLHLELLSHAAKCNGPPSCSLNNCQRMKKLFEHVESCEVTYKKGCKICSRLLALLTMHARMCLVRGSCPLPFCDRIRERNRRREQQQQLMDDRRRQAQNELYRNASTS